MKTPKPPHEAVDERTSFIHRYRVHLGTLAALFLIVLGVFASNSWLPHTDALTGERTGWFGAKLPKNAPSSWNPFALPPPSPTPSLSKSYLYAGNGGRLLAVEDKNAKANPPTDLAVWRASDGTWYVLGETQTSYQFGASGDKPVPGDFDGDGKTDFAVYRPSAGVWYVVRSATSTIYISPSFGLQTDIPTVGDFDGDSKTDIAVWRPSDQRWYIIQSSTGGIIWPQFGATGDTPTRGDFDGDGTDDLAVWTPSSNTFYAKKSSDGQTISGYMGTSGTPMCGDYDGDGKADFAVFNDGNGTWYIRSSITGSLLSPFQYGLSGDIPVANDYDADGKVDIAVFRDESGKGIWYINQTTDGKDRVEQWGLGDDIPVPAYFRR